MFCNSRSFTSKFNEEVSSRLVLKIMPNTEKGPLVHSSFLSSHNLSVLPISEPIQMHCVFSKLGVNPEYLENWSNKSNAFFREFSVPFIKMPVSLLF